MTRSFKIASALFLGLAAGGCEIKVSKPTPDPQKVASVSEVKVDGYSIEVQAPKHRVRLGGGRAEIQFEGHRLELELASGKLSVDGGTFGSVTRKDRLQITAEGTLFVNGAERKRQTQGPPRVEQPRSERAVTTTGEKEEPPSAPARVRLTGKGTSFLQLFDVTVAMKTEEAAQKKLANALRQITVTVFKVDDRTGIVVALPAGSISFLDAVQKVFDRAVAVEGMLTTSDDPRLIAASGNRGARRVPVLVAETLTFLDETKRASSPMENAAVVEGVCVKGAFKVGVLKTEWAIENADGRIPLLLPADARAPENRATIKASGKLVASEGQMLLQAAHVAAVKKPSPIRK